MKSTIERLRTWDSRSQVHEPVDRNFRQAFSELDRLKDKLAVGDAVIEKAAVLQQKSTGERARERKIDICTRGRTHFMPL